MLWNTKDKQWLKERKLQWKSLKKRIDLSEDNFDRAEIKVLKNYFLTGEIIKTGDFRDFPPLVLILAWHPSEDINDWWQCYLILKQKHPVEIGDSIARGYKYIIESRTSGISLENPDGVAPNLFINREKDLYHFFFEFEPFIKDETSDDIPYSNGFIPEWRKKTYDSLVGSSLKMLRNYSYQDDKLCWITGFPRNALVNLSKNLTTEYFKKATRMVSERDPKTWEVEYFSRERALYNNRKSLPPEDCVMVEQWVSQIEMATTAIEWRKLWQDSNQYVEQTPEEKRAEKAEDIEDDRKEAAELAAEIDYDEPSPYIDEWPLVVDLLLKYKLISEAQKLTFNAKKYYYLHELLSDLIEDTWVNYGDLTEDIGIYQGNERAEYFGDVVTGYIEAANDKINISQYEEKDYGNGTVKISFQHQETKYQWKFDIKDTIAVSRYYKGITEWANKLLDGGVFFAGEEETFNAYIMPKELVNDLEMLGLESSPKYFD